MPSIKAVLFDLDDTLWPIAPVIARAEQDMYEWLQAHAPAVTERFTIEALRARRMALLKSTPDYRFDMIALRHAGLSAAFSECNEDSSRVGNALDIFNRARNRVDLFEDVQPVLPRLSEHWLLGTISNGPADLGAIGLSHHFRSSIAAYRFGTGKPDPKIFLAACELLDVAPEEAVYVGDDPLLDVEGAQRAGLKGVWMDREGERSTRVLPGHVAPDAICTNLYALEHWLHTTSGTGGR